MRNALPAAVAVLTALAPLHVSAEEDAEGSKDHPAVKRYPGSYISSFNEKEFEVFPFPISGTAVEKARAESVKQWLVSKHGAEASRLETAGFGDTKPVAENKTDEGRAQNRRVELVRL
jgi:hypothetical protein